MTNKQIRVGKTLYTTADCATAYEIASNSAGYPDWSATGSFEEVVPGADERFGVGSRRIFRTAGMSICEEIMVADRPHHLAYRLISGLPLKEYMGRVDFTVEGERVRIDWYSTFIPPKGFGWFWRRFMKWILSDILAALVKEAEKRMARGG